MPEALAASTINAAAALGLSESHGSLEVSKVGDMVVLNTPRWVERTFEVLCTIAYMYSAVYIYIYVTQLRHNDWSSDAPPQQVSFDLTLNV